MCLMWIVICLLWLASVLAFANGDHLPAIVILLASFVGLAILEQMSKEESNAV